MAIISDAMLAMVKSEMARSLVDRCRIERALTTLDENGGSVETWEIVADNEPCRVIQMGSSDSSQALATGERETLRRAYKLIVSVSVAVSVDYRVTIGADVYDIIRIEDALSDEVFHSVLMSRR